MRRGTVVSLFDRTRVALLPWARDGYRCVAVDIAPAPLVAHPSIRHVATDVRSFLLPRRVRFAMAWPPCTHLASSGARWWKRKGDSALTEALELVETAVDLMSVTGAPWLLENPVGRLARYWRKPDVCVDPWMFAGWSVDPAANSYTKKTCLWLGNGAAPQLLSPAPGVPVDTRRIHNAPSCSPRRSVTPDGLATAIWAANH